jgi:hypothetical protein
MAGIVNGTDRLRNMGAVTPGPHPSISGDGIHNLDLSVFKVFPFGERMKLQLPGEFFNFTNTPRFGEPNTAFGDPAFGTREA